MRVVPDSLISVSETVAYINSQDSVCLVERPWALQTSLALSLTWSEKSDGGWIVVIGRSFLFGSWSSIPNPCFGDMRSIFVDLAVHELDIVVVTANVSSGCALHNPQNDDLEFSVEAPTVIVRREW